MGRGSLPPQRYQQIECEVAYMYEEAQIDAFPMDCFEIAQRLYYEVRRYSKLDPQGFLEALSLSDDAFSRVEQDDRTGLYRYVIYYNDYCETPARIRWSMFHEIGHCFLGHHDNPGGLGKTEEDEANYFAKYAIAPPPLIRGAGLATPAEVQQHFEVSHQASCNCFDLCQKRFAYGPQGWREHELRLLRLFHLAA